MPIVPVDKALNVKELGGDRRVLRSYSGRFPGLVYFHVYSAKIDVRAGALRVLDIECCVTEVPISILGTVLDGIGRRDHLDSMDLHERCVSVHSARWGSRPLVGNAWYEAASSICCPAVCVGLAADYPLNAC
jgi:hypothetical protein